jgi:hypothetical protein
MERITASDGALIDLLERVLEHGVLLRYGVFPRRSLAPNGSSMLVCEMAVGIKASEVRAAIRVDESE